MIHIVLLSAWCCISVKPDTDPTLLILPFLVQQVSAGRLRLVNLVYTPLVISLRGGGVTQHGKRPITPWFNSIFVPEEQLKMQET